MKKYLLLLIASLSLPSAYGQNLVPNPSFEDTTQCPTFFHQITYATGWDRPTTGTPDYFNACTNYNPIDIPQNIEGFEYAKTGVAYAGVLTTSINGANNSYREYIQTKLTDTLITGIHYYVSFYVSPGDSCGYRCNSIGAYLSPTAISSTNSNPLPFIPQISNPSSNPLTNQNGWILVTDTFIALGGEVYITIGNFNNGPNSDTINVGGGVPGLEKASYYYIDDVSVLVDHSAGINMFYNELMPKFFPNPFFWQTTLQTDQFLKNASLTVYNSAGQTVKRIDNLSGTTVLFQRDNLPSGLYFVRLTQDGNTISADKFVITDK